MTCARSAIAIAAAPTPTTRASTSISSSPPSVCAVDERDEHDRREQVDDGLHVPRKRATSDENRPGGFARDGCHADDRDDDPRVAHRRSPRRHAAEAATIGTPAGANGISTSVIPAASAAASTRTAIAEIRHREREEERRESRVEAEGVRIVQHSADHGSERRAPDPEDVEEQSPRRRGSATRSVRDAPTAPMTRRRSTATRPACGAVRPGRSTRRSG